MSESFAVLTGGSSGIGSAIIRKYLNEGWRIATIGRNTERITEMADLIGARDRVVPIRADLTSLAETDAAITQIANLGEPINVLMNIAGVWHDSETVFYGKRLWELPADQLETVMSVGLMAPLRLARGLVPLMLGIQGATILNLTGTFNSGGANWIHYFTSKRGLEQMTLALADELKPESIRVNCISPADTATDALVKFFPEDAKDALTPERVAEFVWLVNSPKFTNVTGQIIEMRA